MKIYTSHYKKVKELEAIGIVPICISIGVPQNFKGPVMHELAPTRGMLKMSEEEYDMKFMEILNKLNPYKVLSDLRDIGGGADVAILCYETLKNEKEMCHRQYVSWWLNKEVGVDILEFGRGNDKYRDLTKRMCC